MLIGINDIWHHRSAGQPIDAAYLANFKATYRQLLTDARQDNPDLQIILLQPFLLPLPSDYLEWEQELQPMTEILEAVASEFKAEYIPLHDHFKRLVHTSPAEHFTIEDGVHPTRVGHGVIAEQWLGLLE